MKEFPAYSKNDLLWELATKFETALSDGGELNFDKSCLHFNVNKKIYGKVALTVNIQY